MTDPYAPLAQYYDLLIGHRNEVPIVLDLIYRFHPDPRTLLELACGTGALLEQFSDHFHCTGLDISPEMLALARERLPEQLLYEQDMATFSLDETYDVIVCLFNSINHLPSFSSWKKVFRRAAKHLKPGGLFIFDMNTVTALREYDAHGDLVEDHGDTVTTVEYCFDPKEVLHMNIRVFTEQENGLYRRTETTIRERAYATEDVRRALQESFRSVTLIDPERSRVSSKSEVVYGVCGGARSPF